MKPFLNPLTCLAAIALLAVGLVGCASHMQDTENLAVAAGFKIITPTKPDQIALLQKMHKGKVSRINYEGKTYFVLPDQKHHTAYVGRETEYQKYEQLLMAQKQATENLEAAQIDEMNTMNWGGWGGWGAWGGPGPGMW